MLAKNSSISSLGPSQIFSPEGPVTANSEKIRDALRVMSTRYISLWQLGFISAGMQLTMFLLAPQRAKDVLFDEASKTAYSIRYTLYDNVQYWAPCLLAVLAMLFLKRSRTLPPPSRIRVHTRERVLQRGLQTNEWP